jgi:hypothetical protein
MRTYKEFLKSREQEKRLNINLAKQNLINVISGKGCFPRCKLTVYDKCMVLVVPISEFNDYVSALEDPIFSSNGWKLKISNSTSFMSINISGLDDQSTGTL